MSDPENGKRARPVSERVSGHSDAYRPLPTSHYVSSARRSKPGSGAAAAAAAHGAFAAGLARGNAGPDSGGNASSFIMSLLLGQERWARGPCAWHPTCNPSGRATGLSAIGANGSFCRRSFAPLSPAPALPQLSAATGAAGDRWSRANTLRTASGQGSFTTPSIQRASQHPPHSQRPGKLHNTLHTAGFTEPSAQRAAREASQHPPYSGLHNTLHTAGFTTPSIQRASQNPPHSGQPGKLHNTLHTAGFTTPSAQREKLHNTLRTAREASQHPPHSERSFTTPSAQREKLHNTLRTAREVSQHPPHSGLHTPSAQRASHTLRTAGFTTPSAQREKLHNTLRTAGFTTPSTQRALQHSPHSGLHNTLHTAGSKGNFTTPFTQWAAGKFHNTLHTGSGGWGGVGDYTTATTMTAGWRLRHCWIQHFST